MGQLFSSTFSFNTFFLLLFSSLDQSLKNALKGSKRTGNERERGKKLPKVTDNCTGNHDNIPGLGSSDRDTVYVGGDEV